MSGLTPLLFQAVMCDGKTCFPKTVNFNVGYAADVVRSHGNAHCAFSVDGATFSSHSFANLPANLTSD